MSHESESNQDIVFLDMEKGMHVPRYPQKFVYAPKSQYPNKASDNGKHGNPAEIIRACGYNK